TMNRPQRRNALSLEHMRELIAAFRDLGGSHVLGIVLAGNGPVFSAGHADRAGRLRREAQAIESALDITPPRDDA
ncbi:MAG: enoyl-CoA hydratase-related protein, partial [Trebonia sp.]